MAIVLLGFVLMNVSLYIVLPMDAIRYPKTVAVVGQVINSSFEICLLT